MTFSHSFFEDEIRCDYFVPSMVKRTWAAHMEILDDLDRACLREHLEYFADWGTLLGTVRHGGFIPWDDDMDICMKRRDYMYLIDNVSRILPDNYSIVSYRSSRDFGQMICRIVSSDHYRFDPEYMHKYSGLPIALGIDIFPLDFMTDDEEYEADREERVNLVDEAVNEIAVFHTPVRSLYERLDLIEKRCGVKIDRKGDVLTQLRALLEKLFGEVEEKDAKYITLYPLWLNRHRYRFPVQYYKRSIRLPFENMTVPVPVCYGDVLSLMYGKKYMMPVRSGSAHDYPYYEKHVNVLREHFGFEWPSYKFDPDDLPKRSVTGASGKENGKKSALFITYDPKAYENMRSLVLFYDNKGYDVTVLPVTKYDIAPDMTGIAAARDDTPDDHYTEGCAKVTHDPGIIHEHPDVIVTNYGYDEYNLITTVDKAFYSTSLSACCDRLIYIPAFEQEDLSETDERSRKLMPLYVNTKLATVCDEIVVHSDGVRRAYVESLSLFSSGSYRNVWEEKIKVLPRPKEDHLPAYTGKKKKVMFYIGLAAFARYGHGMIERIGRVLGMLDKYSESIEPVIKLQKGLEQNLKEMFPDLYEEYAACGIGDMAKGYDDAGDTDLHDIDAYYGEASEYATRMLSLCRPVMIMNFEER